MNSNTYEIVKNAIMKRKQIVAEYQGHKREMCPHVIGTKKGRKQALFYQFGGTSSSGPIERDSTNNWRCIPIDGLNFVEIRDGAWHSFSPHKQRQTCVDEIDVEVEHGY